MKRNLAGRARHNIDKIRNLLEQKELENVSIKDFCRANNITESTYYNWKKRVSVQIGPISTSFTPAMLHDPLAGDQLFAEIERHGKIIIRIFRQVPAEYLKLLC